MEKAAHPSLQRLLDFAKLATQHQRRPVLDWPDLQERLGVSSAVMTNWKRRGVSQAGAINAESVFGCAAHWLLTGESHPGGPAQSLTATKDHWTPSQRSPAGSNVLAEPVAQFMSLHLRSDPPIVSWEGLMAPGRPTLFRIALPDNALAPDLFAGDELTIDTSLTPMAGDIVLMRDAAGNHYARQYRIKRPGEWSGHPTNPAFEPLDAARDRLAIVGVSISETRKRRRSSFST